MSEDGKVWSPGAVEFFRILNEQIGVVVQVGSDIMLLRVAQVGGVHHLCAIFRITCGE